MRSLSALCVLCALCATPASAQVERPQRMAHGLFGAPSGPDPEARTTLDLDVQAFGAYDDDVIADENHTAAALDPHVQQSGFYSGLTAGAELNRTGRTFDFGLSGGTSARYYAPLNDVVALGEQAGVGFAAHDRSRHFRIDANARHQPFYAVAPFVALAAPALGDVAPIAANAVVFRRNVFAYGGNTTYEQEIGGRSSFAITGGLQRIEYLNAGISDRPFQTYLAGGRYSRHLTSGMSLRLGYIYQLGILSSLAPRTAVHNLDAGLDYDKALGRTRRTHLTASFGSAIVDQYGTRTYRALGDAALKHEIGRTWSIRGAYHRGVGFLDGFNTPFYADSASASAQGLLTRRLDLSTVLAYTNGELGLVSRANAFDTYSSTTRLRFAFTQMLAVFGEYVAYHYDFTNGAGLPSGLPSRMNRQGVRGGLTLWVPVLR